LDIITIATFADPMQAELAKIWLETHGVECFLADRNIATIQLTVGMSPSVRLQVPEVEIERAEEILSRLPDHTQEEIDPKEEEPPALDPPTQEEATHQNASACPKCKANRIEKSRDLTFTTYMLAIVLLGLPLLFIKPTNHCKRCGHTWKTEKVQRKPLLS
jgi:hypothetical protein